jgi:hypothetical protein
MNADEKQSAKLKANVYFAYVFDLGHEIKSRAFQAMEERAEAVNETDRLYESGRVMAYGEVIALMRQMALGLGIPLSDVRLDDVVDDEFV